MLLYLTKDTWTSESAGPLAKEVAEALLDGVPIVLVHENDPGKGAVPFSDFFEMTPPRLIKWKLYASQLAIPMHR